MKLKSRKVQAVAVGLALAGAVGLGVSAQAQAQASDITMGQGPGRHFFMFVDKTGTNFVGEARVFQNGREILRLGDATNNWKYSEQWESFGRQDETLEVKLRTYRVGPSGAEIFGEWETYTLAPDMNTCYKRLDGADKPMVKVGDSLAWNCTPD